MTPRFSCADFTFPLLPHEGALRLIGLLGIDAVDLGIFEGRSHHYPSRIARDPAGEARRIGASLGALGMTPADVFLQTGPEPPVAAANTPDPAVRESNRSTFLGVAEFAAALGCRHLTGLPGVRHRDLPEADDWARAAEEAAWRLERAREFGLAYAVEPHVGSLAPDPASALRLLAAAPGLTLTLDYGHFIYQGFPDEAVHPLLPHASHFHARGGARGQLQSTVADNAIGFPEILRRLGACGYDGFVCLEYVHVDWEGCNRTDNVSETLRLKSLLASAR